MGCGPGLDSCSDFIASVSFLQDLRLNDDTVLDQINFAEPDQHDLPDLQAEEQAVMLGVW